MLRFSSNAIFFLLLQAMLFAFLRDPTLSSQSKCIARTIEKHRRLENTPPPRVILVGGSNVSFGFAPEILQAELAKPVVNMGLAAALGIEFMLNEIRSSVARGDIVILSFEYDLFSGGRDQLVIRQLLEMRPSSIRFVPTRDFKQILTEYGFHWIGGVMRRNFLPPAQQPAYSLDAWDYARNDFDESNTYFGHHQKTNTFAAEPIDSPLRARPKISPINLRVFRQIAEFAALCEQRGAKCYFTCPPQPPELLTTNIEPIRANIEKLREIEQLSVLDAPEDHVYPPDQLFDVQYHLTKEGARRRTRFVTERITSRR